MPRTLKPKKAGAEDLGCGGDVAGAPGIASKLGAPFAFGFSL